MFVRSALTRIALLSVFAVSFVLPSLAEDQKTRDLDVSTAHEVFPHIAIGGPWTTTLTFVNVSTSTAQFPLRFFRPDGQPWTVTTSTGITDSAFSVTVGVFSSLDVELLSPGTQVQTGWAEIEQPPVATVGGHAVFRDKGGAGRPIPFEAVVPLSTFSEGSTSLLPGFRTSVLPFDQTRGFDTCVALANNSQSNTSTVSLVMPVQGGAIPLGPDIVLPPRTQTSFCLRNRFPQTEGQKGGIVIGRPVSNLPLSVLGFRFDPQGAFTTFLPMSKL